MSLDVVSWSGPSMGGRLDVRVAVDDESLSIGGGAQVVRVGHRVDGWASRLTRFAESSDLSRLNRDESGCSEVRPTLAAVLSWAWDRRRALAARGGRDVAGRPPRPPSAALLRSPRLPPPSARGVGPSVRAGTLEDRAGPGRSSLVTREARHHRFDLDGVAKGWIADRALALLCRWPGALVDADGDIAISVAPGADWHVAVENPQDPDGPPLAVLRIAAPGPWHQSVWRGHVRHHGPSLAGGDRRLDAWRDGRRDPST